MGLGDPKAFNTVQDGWKQARSWLQALAEKSPDISYRPRMINATGQLLGEQFERVPMNPAVALDWAAAATGQQQEQHPLSRSRQAAMDRFQRPVAWINHPLGALLLLHKLAPAGIVISRADAVRVPGFGDVRAMLTAFGNAVTETGAANGAQEKDWESALTSKQQIALLVSPNSLSRQAAAEQRAAALKAAKLRGASVVELLIDGVVSQELSNQYGFPDVAERLSSGADLVLLPMHLLMAAPPVMLACGQQAGIRALDAAALELGLQCNWPQVAAAETAMGQTPASLDSPIGLLLANPSNLKNRCQRLAIQLNDSEKFLAAVAVQRSCELGPTPWDRYRLENWAVQASPRAASRSAAEQVHGQLLQSTQTQPSRPGIATLVQGTDVLIDLRFVPPEDDHQIALACLGQAALDAQPAQAPQPNAPQPNAPQPNAPQPNAPQPNAPSTDRD